MEVSGQLNAPSTLFPRKETRYPLDRKLDGPQSRSTHGGEEKFPWPSWESSPCHPARSVVAILTGLSRLEAENTAHAYHYLECQIKFVLHMAYFFYRCMSLKEISRGLWPRWC